jgi:hypothetical protein
VKELERRIVRMDKSSYRVDDILTGLVLSNILVKGKCLDERLQALEEVMKDAFLCGVQEKLKQVSVCIKAGLLSSSDFSEVVPAWVYELVKESGRVKTTVEDVESSFLSLSFSPEIEEALTHVLRNRYKAGNDLVSSKLGEALLLGNIQREPKRLSLKELEIFKADNSRES